MVVEQSNGPARSVGRRRAIGLLLLLLVIACYGSALLVGALVIEPHAAVVALPLAPFALFGLWFGLRDAWLREGRWLRSTLTPFVLIVMVGVGLLINRFELKAECVENGCDTGTPY